MTRDSFRFREARARKNPAAWGAPPEGHSMFKPMVALLIIMGALGAAATAVVLSGWGR